MKQPISIHQPKNNKVENLVNRPAFINTVIILILINSVLVGLETSNTLMRLYGDWFHLLDLILLWLFTVEIALRLIAVRPTPAFFKNGWNVFDFIIVMSGHVLVGGQFITVLRILRILRVFRTFSVIPSLRRLVNAILLSIPALGNILLLMSLVFYVFGVTGTVLFAKAAPEYFGSLPTTVLTLFQVATLESWASGVMRPLLIAAPYSWIYFVIFIMIGTFVVINLFLGVIVSSMEKADQMEKDEMNGNSDVPEPDETRGEINHLRQEIAELKSIILEKQGK
jgi:voltage-gated sodium channel